MKTKRLKHNADILCKMFCGWQLLVDYKALTELGGGKLTIDVLNSTSLHNGKPVKLEMANVLNSWLSTDLESNGIPRNSIKSAILTVDFSTERHLGQRDMSMRWARPTKDFISCPLKCFSSINTIDKEFTSHYEEIEEWPTNYGQ